ncbi:MAG: hypothetical protein RLZZ576_745 [Actinomycetota bacterium]|jgi:hypothetical protein
MKTTMRKIASVTAALAMSLGMLVATAAPANAVYANEFEWFPSPQTFEVGDTIDLDFSCKPSYDGEVVGESASQIGVTPPPGTVMGADWHLRGTFTTVGTYDVGWVRCFSGTDTVSNWLNEYIGTVVIVPATTPAPSLSATVLGNNKCEVRLVGVLPATPDAGTATITATFGSESSVLTLRNYAASEIIDITLSMNNFAASAQSNPNIASVTSGPQFSCGNEIIFTLGYQHAGAPVATAQSIVTTRGLAVEPTVWVSTVLDQACTVRIQAAVAQFTDDDLLRITVSAGIGGWDIQYKDVTPDNPLDTVIDFANAPSDEEDPRVASVFIWGEPFDCQNAGIQAGTKYNGIAVDVKIVSTAVVRSICAPGTYGKVEFDGSLVYRECLPAPPGTSVATANVLAEPVQCAPGTYADVTGLATCKQAEPGSYAPGYGSFTTVPCAPGTFADISGSPSCQPAPKGYYISDQGAVTATKCPAGLTTELTGARSIHDCYKQKFQTAKAIKTPTKLKFGAKHETAGRADAGLALDAVATGSCTVTKINKTVKINGKSVKQPRWVIKATNKAGNCKVTFSNPGDYTYKPFTVTKTIKVTKTGK